MSNQPTEKNNLSRAVARIQARILALVMAIFGGIIIFLLTVWLLIKGGDEVGPHLKLLGEYFIGYTVTWPGAFIGLIYGAVVGWIAGWCIGYLYNWVLRFRGK